MKRSEMIKLMLESYCKPVPYHDEGGVQLMWKLDRLLEDMEEAGMLPPGIDFGIRNTYGEVELFHEWEDGDAKK